MSEEIKTSHFKTMKELLEHLKMWERDDDYEAYCRFFDYECAYAMAHYIDKLQKENEKLDEKFRYAVPDEIIEELYVSKNKIREKIKELEEEQKGKIFSINPYTKETSYENINNKREIKVLEELLGE